MRSVIGSPWHSKFLKFGQQFIELQIICNIEFHLTNASVHFSKRERNCHYIKKNEKTIQLIPPLQNSLLVDCDMKHLRPQILLGLWYHCILNDIYRAKIPRTWDYKWAQNSQVKTSHLLRSVKARRMVSSSRYSGIWKVERQTTRLIIWHCSEISLKSSWFANAFWTNRQNRLSQCAPQLYFDSIKYPCNRCQHPLHYLQWNRIVYIIDRLDSEVQGWYSPLMIWTLRSHW